MFSFRSVVGREWLPTDITTDVVKSYYVITTDVVIKVPANFSLGASSAALRPEKPFGSADLLL